MTKKLKFSGKSQSIVAWATDLGISPGTLASRLKRHALKVALDPDFRNKRRKLYKARGRRQTLQAWATELKVRPSTLRSRLRVYSVEVALSPDFGHRFRHDGRAQTLSRWAEEVGIPMGTLAWRVANGWTMEDALTRERPTVYGKIRHLGEDLTAREWATKLGYTRKVIYHRLATMSLEAALMPIGTSKRGPVAKQIRHNGRSQTVAEWAAELGINPQTLRERLRRHPLRVALSVWP